MLDTEFEIQKAIESWEFHRVKLLYEFTFKETDRFKMPYVKFLNATRQLRALSSFLAQYPSKPSWWDNSLDFAQLKVNIEGDFESIVNSNLKSFDLEIKDFRSLPILAQKFILKQLICHYIKQNIKSASFVKLNLLLSDFDEYGARNLAEEFVKYLSFKKPLARIAILICGILRGDYLKALYQIHRQVAIPLNADMFLFSWDKSAEWIGASGNGVGWLRGCFADEIVALAPREIVCANNNFRAKFPRTFKKICKEKLVSVDCNLLKQIPSLKDFRLESQEKFMNQFNIASSTMKMFYGYAKSLEILESYEQKYGLRYDYLVRIRPDMIYENISLERILSVKDNEILCANFPWGVGDMVEIGKAKTLKLYLNTFNIAKFYQKLDIFKDYPKAIVNSDDLNMDHSKAFWYYTSYLGIILREARVKVYRNNKMLYSEIKLPNCQKEIEQDLQDLCNNGVFNAKQTNAVRNFFELIFVYKQALLTSALSRIHSHLAYKLGSAMILNSKSLLGYIRMPYVLSYIKESHKKEILEYEAKVAKNPSLKLPKLESYPDYQEALKEKQCFTYQLGEALIKANSVRGGGANICLFAILPRSA